MFSNGGVSSHKLANLLIVSLFGMYLCRVSSVYIYIYIYIYEYHEHGIEVKLYISLNVIFRQLSYRSSNEVDYIKFIELSKVVLHDLQYLLLLQLHSPFQLVVLDGHCSRLPLYIKK